MSHQSINTHQAPQAIGPYSQAIVAYGFVFCSGQVGVNPQTGMIAQTVEEQTTQVMHNLSAILTTAGITLQHIVKTTIFLVDIKDFAAVNTIYASFFPGIKPARSTVQVAQLPKGKLPIAPLVEIDAIAATEK